MARKVRRHSVTIYRTISINAVDEDCQISGTPVPGTPERGPSYSCAGEPAEPPHVEDIEVVTAEGAGVPIDFDSLSPRDQALIEVALLDAAADREEAAREHAEDARRDAYRDRMRGLD